MKTRRTSTRTIRTRRPSPAAIIQSAIRLEERVWKAAQQRNAREFTKLVPADAVMIFQTGIVPQPEYLATGAGGYVNAILPVYQ